MTIPSQSTPEVQGKTALDLIREAFDMSQMPYVIRDGGNGFLYLFVGDKPELQHADLDWLIIARRYMEFEDGSLVSA